MPNFSRTNPEHVDFSSSRQNDNTLFYNDILAGFDFFFETVNLLP